jgi:hypothetical protein
MKIWLDKPTNPVHYRLQNIVSDLCSYGLIVLELTISTPAQWLDVYEIGETQLKHVQRASVIPAGKTIWKFLNTKACF